MIYIEKSMEDKLLVLYNVVLLTLAQGLGIL